VFIDRLSWDNFNESGDLKSQAEKFKIATGNYPESIHVDQIYRTIAITFLVMNLSTLLMNSKKVAIEC
jgi:hypothetical protein